MHHSLQNSKLPQKETSAQKYLYAIDLNVKFAAHNSKITNVSSGVLNHASEGESLMDEYGLSGCQE